MGNGGRLGTILIDKFGIQWIPLNIELQLVVEDESSAEENK